MSDLDHVTEIGRVLQGHETGRDGLVAESWRRCVETYGMDPARPDPACIVTEAQLRQHREQSERLIATARSGLHALFRQVAGQNYVLLLADAKGVCVDFFGDPRFEDDLRAAGLYLGSDWSEELAGTCGVGSCIVTGEAVTIHQGDHFGLAHTPLSCTSAPIYDTCGQLTAVLDISLLRSPGPKTSQNLAMNLVKAAARRVEMANLMAMTRREWVLRFSTSPEFLEVDPDAAVAIDGSGKIIGMTHGARTTLAPERETTLIGENIEALMDVSVDDLPDLMRGRPAEERVFRLKDGRGLFGHTIAPQSARVVQNTRSGQLDGVLAGFAGPDPALERLLKQVARLAPTRVPLLLSGETGTGKERLARAIHVASSKNKAFQTLRCAGADHQRIAALQDAREGTLFLRGVEDLRDDGQAALLSLIEARSDLRIIASARADLLAIVKAGSFRDDLYFRLAGGCLSLPPLRLRHDFDWLIDRLMRPYVASGIRLSPQARAALRGHDWPGNIRELESVLAIAAAIVEGQVIDLPDIPVLSGQKARRRQETEDLENLLDACGWNMAQAARRLGVNRSTVMRRVRKSGLTPPL